MLRKIGLLACMSIVGASCGSSDSEKTKIQQETTQFLATYTQEFLDRYAQVTEAQWKANIEIIAGDTTNMTLAKEADAAMAAFTGSTETIEEARRLLAQKDKLKYMDVKQLEAILYMAANNPQTIQETVEERIAAENEQTRQLYGFQYRLDGKKVSTNQIDDILKKETDVNRRLKAWEASKEVGPVLKPGLTRLRDLRNKTVQALGYDDYFSYQVSDYGMETEEMMETMNQLMNELYPLYRELHTWMRYELASRYGVDAVPDYLPAHWLPNRWGQDWSPVISVEGMNVDSVLSRKTPEWIMKEGEKLYTSLGFPELPRVFWEKSSLYPYPADSAVKKNNHASAWHMDLQNDVRSLMSVEPNAEWFETVNHELGHIYYFMTYTNNSVPPLLRAGANRAYHEAIGTMMGMAAMQKPYLVARGLVSENAEVDSIQTLLKEALNSVVFIFFSSGTMTHFEKALYVDNLPEDQFNQTWWDMARKFQGIVPPSPRDEHYCDAATKTHINDDAAQYYDYALSYVILYQLHNHIAENILGENPRATNYYGRKEIGDFLTGIMYPGASKDWRVVLEESTGSKLSAREMLEYFDPLVDWLKDRNQGRKYTLAEANPF